MASDLVERLEHLAREGDAAGVLTIWREAADRIAHQDAVIAGLVSALEKARSDLHLIALESRISYDVQRMVVASKEHCHEALAKAKESRDV